MLKQLRPAVVSLLLFTLITGVVYPLVVTGIAQVVFPHQANGSLIVMDGKAVWLGTDRPAVRRPQVLLGPPVRHGRLSVQRLQRGNADGFLRLELRAAESGAHRQRLRRASMPSRRPTRSNTAPIPVDLVTASGSGLDPHISVAAAYYQVHRVAQARGLSDDAGEGSGGQVHPEAASLASWVNRR